MNFKDLLDHFAGVEDFPIDAYDVAERIKAVKKVHQIQFYAEPAMDPNCMWGFLDRYTLEGNPNFSEMADIYYAAAVDLSNVNLILTKELIGILDEGEAQTKNAEGISRLITEGVVPAMIATLNTVSAPTRADHLATVCALIILVPPHARTALLEPYQSKKTNDSEIAELFNIPEEFVPWVMSDAYDAWLKKLI